MEEKFAVEQLAEYVSALKWEDMPSQVHDKLKLCVRDALECCLSPMQDIRSRAAFSSVEKDGPSHRATLFATGHRASAEDAAFYNTVKGALTSRNDSSRTAICHPGSILIPVVFGLGEEKKLSGKQVLEAILAGYETMIRLGNTFVSARINGSWRNTALVAPFGAAFAAAKAMGLNTLQTASSASFACHFAGGLNEWAVAGTGEDVFQNGWGARNGILAMRLAAAGAQGCLSILEGKNGLLTALGAQEQKTRLTERLGEEYKILEIMHKPIDSCFLVQGPCQAAQNLVDQNKEKTWRAEDIDNVCIEVAGQAKAYPGCDNNSGISSLVQGIMSIQLGVASTLVRGSCDGIVWAPPIDRDILDLMRKCTLRENHDMTERFPQKQGARVTVKMKSGASYSYYQDDVRPLTPDQVNSRFAKTACKQLGKEKADQLEKAIENMEYSADVTEITQLLA